MSEATIINKYINELATANHQKFVAQDEVDTLRTESANKDQVIESLKQALAHATSQPEPIDIVQGDIVES